MIRVTRRYHLVEAGVKPTTNAGLWLDKYIRDQDRSSDARASLVEQVAAIRQPECYSVWFSRWKQCLEGSGASCRRATVTGRMAVGLGEDSVLETSIMLHHTLGVPYIPGTALKGLASSFARQWLGDDWQPGAASRAHSVMFGDSDSASYLTFFDAMPVPGTSRLLPDVMTVHHPDYYQTGNVPPADWDGPNPVPFLSADGVYLIALAGPEEWVTAAFDLLKHSLEIAGVGAKTSSGYGRLSLELGPPVPPVEPEQKEVADLIQQIEVLPNSAVAGSIHGIFEQWQRLEAEPEQKRRVAKAIIEKVKQAGRENKSRDKAWYRELLGALQ
ncbi:MAG: type III-B CRISPR module RAMP protein Cmr6 [Clostridia bacterium]|nr:type III-B CRISPR module RAMP protein Cmr6 [Clostridia bacterium]